jgi:hypothetical protein
MEQYLIKEIKVHNGIQKIYRFENGFGASIIQHQFSYGNELGLWEVGVLEFEDELYSLNYETEITDDVIGNLTLEQVEEVLNKIKNLKGLSYEN